MQSRNCAEGKKIDDASWGTIFHLPPGIMRPEYEKSKQVKQTFKEILLNELSYTFKTELKITPKDVVLMDLEELERRFGKLE